MDTHNFNSTQTRRDFFKSLGMIGAILQVNPTRILNAGEQNDAQKPNFAFKYRTIPVNHLPQLQEDIDYFKRNKLISEHETYQSYIKNKIFKLPDDFQDAKSVIALAIYTPLMFVNVHHKGKVYDLMMPPQYYDDGITLEQIEQAVQKQIIKKTGYRVERAKQFHLKRLAARSGLGKYGRSNLIFVDGFGNCITLYAYFTDFVFPEDHWQEVKMLENCTTCRICVKQCPTKAITMKNFVIDAGKCIPLYNEVPGEFPLFIKKAKHNALMGCMWCQVHCPANHEVHKKAGRLDDITEEETRKILDGKPDQALFESLQKKLRGFYPSTSEEYFPVFTRNLKVLI